MELLSLSGLIAILSLTIWVFIVPFLYPKYIDSFLSDIAPKTYNFIFWTFFLSYFAMGSLMIIKGFSSVGLYFILALTLAYGLILYLTSKKVLKFGIFSLILEFVYNSTFQIIFWLFTASMFAYSIYVFYKQSVILGSILSYTTLFHLFITSIGLWWYAKNIKNKVPEIKTIQNLKDENSTKHKIDLKQVLKDFEPDISNDFFNLSDKINALISALTEFVYADYIPEKLRKGSTGSLIIVLKDYVLSDPQIPEAEKALVNNIIEKRKELYLWKSNFLSESAFITDNSKSDKKSKSAKTKPPKQAGK